MGLIWDDEKRRPVLIRDLFYPARIGKGEPRLPRRLKSSGVKRMIEDALRGTGIRKALTEGKKRHEFHSLREQSQHEMDSNPNRSES